MDDVRELRTKNGKPYTVFTPFWRTALGAPHREVIGAPRKVSMPSKVRKGQRAEARGPRPRGARRGPRGGRGDRGPQAPLELRALAGRALRQLPGRPRRRRHLAALALPALRLPLTARGGGAVLRRRPRAPAPSAGRSTGPTSTTT
ncbi:MAG: hypothetical protein WKF31_03460 [Thermoleophilaceae bacterium]